MCISYFCIYQFHKLFGKIISDTELSTVFSSTFTMNPSSDATDIGNINNNIVRTMISPRV